MPPQGHAVSHIPRYIPYIRDGSLLSNLPFSHFVESRLFSPRVRIPSRKEYFCKERRQTFSQGMPPTPCFASPTVSPAWFLLCSPRETWSKFSPNKRNKLRWTLDSWRRGVNLFSNWLTRRCLLPVFHTYHMQNHISTSQTTVLFRNDASHRLFATARRPKTLTNYREMPCHPPPLRQGIPSHKTSLLTSARM